jgi:hypothetical protein
MSDISEDREPTLEELLEMKAQLEKMLREVDTLPAEEIHRLRRKLRVEWTNIEWLRQQKVEDA